MPLSTRPPFCRILLCAALLAAAVPPAHALLNLDGSRNQLFVFGSLAYGYSSNMFAEPVARGDYTVTAQVGAELQRRAGIIAVNSTAKIDFVHYGKFKGEDAINPNFSLELNKSTGRTTGALTVHVYRETRSDSAVNLRTSSWNFPIGLNLKYPINDNFYATSSTGYLRRTYSESQSLVNYTDFSEAVDLYYVYTSKLDLLAGYRIRAATTSIDGRFFDHWFNIGATGGLFSKMSGTLRFGYQFRDVRGTGGERFDHFNVQGSLAWPITRKILLSLQLSRDFNTIATGASVDSTSVSLHATYAYTRKIEFSGTISGGRNDFLSRNPPNRRDTFFSWDAGVSYRMNEHFRLGASYTYLHNWSTASLADFESHGFSLEISSRF